jgi:hypothetical protein
MSSPPSAPPDIFPNMGNIQADAMFYRATAYP